jgi:hypothetical protein
MAGRLPGNPDRHLTGFANGSMPPPYIGTLEEANHLRLNAFDKLVSGPLHFLQLFSGISKKIHSQAAEIWLIVSTPLQKRQITFAKDKEHISVAARNCLPPGQRAEKPDLVYFVMPSG